MKNYAHLGENMSENNDNMNTITEEQYREIPPEELELELVRSEEVQVAAPAEPAPAPAPAKAAKKK